MKTLLFILLSLLFISGCSTSSDDPEQDSRMIADDDDSSEDDDVTGDDDATGDDDDNDDDLPWESGWGIKILPDDFGFDTGCLDGEPNVIGDCIDGLLDTLNPMEEVTPIEEMEAIVEDIRNGVTQQLDDTLPISELVDTIYLLSGAAWLDEKDEIYVTLVGGDQFDDYRWEILLFEGRTGQFIVYLFLPHEKSPLPVVVNMHGHGSNLWEFRDWSGEEILEAGIGIAAINSLGIGWGEDEVTRLALTKGISFEILRAYEYFAVARYIKYRAQHGQKDVLSTIGGIGHSAGSNTIWFAHYIHPPLLQELVKGIVIDNSSSFYNETWKNDHWKWTNDMVPLLFPYSANMLWSEQEAMLIHREDYGYPYGVSDVIDFLIEYIFD